MWDYVLNHLHKDRVWLISATGKTKDLRMRGGSDFWADSWSNVFSANSSTVCSASTADRMVFQEAELQRVLLR